MGISFGHLLIVLVVVLILFGGKNLPEIGKALGKALREFKETQKDITGSMTVEPKPEPPKTEPPKTEPVKAEPAQTSEPGKDPNAPH